MLCCYSFYFCRLPIVLLEIQCYFGDESKINWKSETVFFRSLMKCSLQLHCVGISLSNISHHKLQWFTLKVLKRWEQHSCMDDIKIWMGKIRHINLLMNFHGGTVSLSDGWETFLSCAFLVKKEFSCEWVCFGWDNKGK